MGKQIDNDRAMDSCDAVRHILIDGRNFPMGGPITCQIQFSNGGSTEDEIIVQYKSGAGAYALNCDSFKEWGQIDPIWSNYYEFKWDDTAKILEVKTEKGIIKFKRIK